MADLPPGPSLGAVLAGLDWSLLSSEDMYELTGSLARMVSHYQALLVTAMYDTALTAHEPAGSLKRAAELKDHCADQLAWELHVSRGYAFSQVLLGEALVRRLPLVLADFQAGLIDQARAGVFVDCLSNLDLDTGREIAER